MKKLLLLLTATAVLTGCADDATVAKHNLTKAADNFEVQRRVVFYNTWKGEVFSEYVGKCSVTDETTKFSVICKTGKDTFKRDIVGRNESMTYVVEQLEPVAASVYYYRRTFKPQTVLPDFDFRGAAVLPKSQTEGTNK